MSDAPPVVVFGGTAEGRTLARQLAGRGVRVTVHVATEYGESLLPEQANLSVRTGRLDAAEMARQLRDASPAVAVDATHPYAVEVTGNIRAACLGAAVPYLRVVRDTQEFDGVVLADSTAHAVDLLGQRTGNVLLTTGSKELAVYTAVPGWRERLYARILPDPEGVAKCVELGFRGQHLICMQGPFSAELNCATMRMLDIKTIVSKDTGSAGGFAEKAAAARSCGAELIVISRQAEAEEGLSLPDALVYLEGLLGLPPLPLPDDVTPRFPLFVSLKGREVVVVGGGAIAARRIRTLLQFGADITVIAPELSPELRTPADIPHWTAERYRAIPGSPALVVAATDDRAVNERVGRDARGRNIPVSVADRKEESTFWFPAVALENGLVAGLVSTDGSHGKVKDAAEKIRNCLRRDEG